MSLMTEKMQKKQANFLNSDVINKQQLEELSQAVQLSWQNIAPSWPLKNLIAVNPLTGFEHLPFEQAVEESNSLFRLTDLPGKMLEINRISIKWLQAFYDQGQAIINMPMREQGLLQAVLALLPYDQSVVKKNSPQQSWLKQLPKNAEEVLHQCLVNLNIETQEYSTFMTLMLTTLPGWAAYTQYRCQWADAQDLHSEYRVSHTDFLAFRLVITCLIWHEAKSLLEWHQLQKNQCADFDYTELLKNEYKFQKNLLRNLSRSHQPKNIERAEAQLVFCIDVRSEPYRRAFESTGNYQTLGFAGFFGLPITMHDTIQKESHASCPVLLKPTYIVEQSPCCDEQKHQAGYQYIQGIRRIYQSLKYSFTTPFNLVETFGPMTALWMAIKSFSPNWAATLKQKLHHLISPSYQDQVNTDAIPFQQKLTFAENALSIMGLTENFAPLVIFCGHGSATQNNAYATSLDCGACGGRHGGVNARVLANILNQVDIRLALAKQQIVIPDDTVFLGAEHNTTTDELEIYSSDVEVKVLPRLQQLNRDLKIARDKNCAWRYAQLYPDSRTRDASVKLRMHALDWSQIRPEWGLSRNASFIIGPRWLTEQVDLQGRAFLHSYEWQKDIHQSALMTIMTAPMVVAQWINAQYFFSTMDNVAYGGGSKVSKNISGKFAIMQGNASDLMNGLPLQSVFLNDDQRYHESLRLSVVIYAPKSSIKKVIDQHIILQKLFANGWLYLFCIDPDTQKVYSMSRKLEWKKT